MITERQIQIVTRGSDQGTDVEVFIRAGQDLVPTGIKAPDHEAAAKLVAARLAGTGHGTGNGEG